MCLIIGRVIKKYIANDPITVYKVVVSREGLIGYLTPYQEAYVQLGKTYYSDINIRKEDGAYNVYEALHSFVDIPASLQHMIIPMSGYCSVILKCIIPKGSEYYKGFSIFSGEARAAYASNKLKYIKVIKQFTYNDTTTD